jgi:hypothetical protein
METKICDKCSQEKSVLDYHKDRRLVSGIKNICNVCATMRTKEYYKTVEGKQKRNALRALKRSLDPRIILFGGAKQRAKKNNIVFSIKKEDIIIPDFCPILGLKLKNNNILSDDSITLDRIENSKGYIASNIQVISWKANRLKSNSTIEELQKIINYMIDNNKIYRSTGEKRSVRPTKYYTYNNKSQGLKDWSDELGISEIVLNNRLNRSKWTIERAFTTPVAFKNKSKKNNTI